MLKSWQLMHLASAHHLQISMSCSHSAVCPIYVYSYRCVRSARHNGLASMLNTLASSQHRWQVYFPAWWKTEWFCQSFYMNGCVSQNTGTVYQNIMVEKKKGTYKKYYLASLKSFVKVCIALGRECCFLLGRSLECEAYSRSFIDWCV